MKTENEQSEKFIGDNMKELLLSSFGSMFSVLLDNLEDSETEEKFTHKCAKTIIQVNLMDALNAYDQTKLEREISDKTTTIFSLLADMFIYTMRNEKMPKSLWDITYSELFD